MKKTRINKSRDTVPLSMQMLKFGEGVGFKFFSFSRAGFASEGLSKGSLMEVCFIPPVQM